MGARLSLLFFVTLLGACARVGADADASTESRSDYLDDYEVAIRGDDGVCTLHYRIGETSASVTLLPKPPCFFFRDWQGNIQHYRYADLGPATVAAVVGTPLPAGKIPEALRGREDCGGEIQAVLFGKSDVNPIEQVHVVVRCANSSLDERVFWSLSHPP